mmetsp:Transcript_41927/g.119893  ORF Transcript_41927/g.119893 Transcript_41927/m.119893 type:complete len:263 (-) Transcript_41927:458-1246(-)
MCLAEREGGLRVEQRVYRRPAGCEIFCGVGQRENIARAGVERPKGQFECSHRRIACLWNVYPDVAGCSSVRRSLGASWTLECRRRVDDMVHVVYGVSSHHTSVCRGVPDAWEATAAFGRMVCPTVCPRIGLSSSLDVACRVLLPAQGHARLRSFCHGEAQWHDYASNLHRHLQSWRRRGKHPQSYGSEGVHPIFVLGPLGIDELFRRPCAHSQGACIWATTCALSHDPRVIGHFILCDEKGLGEQKQQQQQLQLQPQLQLQL